MASRFGALADQSKEEQAATKEAMSGEAKEVKKMADKPKGNKKKAPKTKVSKKMEDNQAAVMFYLPEDVKLDLAIYAKKHKKAVAEILRELVVEKIYS